MLAIYHPSFILRLKGREGGDKAFATLVADLRKAGRFIVQDDSGR